MIVINLDAVMAKRKIKLIDLAEKVDITLANLSLLKTGKVRGVRFDTLNKLCEILDCQPGDIIKYKK